MPDKIIAATLQVDTGTSNQNIQNTNKALGDVKETLTETKGEAKDSTTHFGNLKSKFAEMPGPLGSVSKGVETVNTAFKTLLANPIILIITGIVAALVALYKMFASTNEGAEKIEQVFKGLGAVIDVIRDRVLKFATAIGQFLTGHFKDAAKTAGEAITGFGKDVVNAYTVAADATRRLQEAQDELNQVLNVSRAKLERDLASTKELITDGNASYAERKKAIIEVRDAEQSQTEAELRNAEKTLQAIRDKNKLSKNVSDEQLEEEANAQIKVFQIQQQSAQDIRSLNKQERQIESEQQQKDKEKRDAVTADKKKQAQDLFNFNTKLLQLQQENEIANIKDQYQRELRELEIKLDNEKAANDKAVKDGTLTRQQARELELELDRKYYIDYTTMRDKHDKDVLEQQDKDNKERDEKKQKNLEESQKRFLQGVKDQTALYQQAADAQKQVDDLVAANKKKRVDETISVLSNLSNAIGKQTAVGKGLAIAAALINTYQGATEALKQPSTLPSPFDVIAKIANVATVIATGLKSVREITRVPVPGGGGSGATIPATGNVSGGVPAAPVSPTQQSTTIDQNSIKGIGDATSRRAYVLSQDVTHDQDRNERLNRAARLGG